MRLRLLLPGGRRGRGVGGLKFPGPRRRALLGALLGLGWIVAAALGVVLLTQDNTSDPPAARPPAESGSAPGRTAEAGAPQVQETDGDLAIGITEPNPNFVWPPGQGEVEQPFARWRDAFERLRPAYYRLRLDWASLQPSADQPANLDLAVAGCMRDIPPCGAWAGVREQLKAAGARQKKTGMQIITVLAGTPAWAARSPSGCERGGTEPRSRAPRPSAMPAYRKLIADILAVAAQEGVELRFWSAWNEPNHPASLSPQRTRCSGRARTAAVTPYVRLVRALKEALDVAPGDQEYVLGELAGLDRRTPRNTAVEEFARALPDDLVCGARAWSQHAYIGGRDPIDPAGAGIATHECVRSPEFWITETGVGGTSSDRDRETGAAAERSACRAMRSQLLKWYEDPRVTAAFQYTLREDDRFATGLVDVSLSRAYPVLREWQAWGGKRAAQDPPPDGTCG